MIGARTISADFQEDPECYRLVEFVHNDDLDEQLPSRADVDELVSVRPRREDKHHCQQTGRDVRRPSALHGVYPSPRAMSFLQSLHKFVTEPQTGYKPVTSLS